MFGAIAGDIIGSAFGQQPTNSTEFELLGSNSCMTDESVLTVATAHALLNGKDYKKAYRFWGKTYANASYGASFLRWLFLESEDAYDSFNNEAAMRVSPIAWAFDSLEKVLSEAERSARVTHSHPDAVKGAQAVAAAVYLARTGAKIETIRQEIETRFGYDLSTPLNELNPDSDHGESVLGSVPHALRAFLESADWESSVRNAVALGGESDTQSSITGSVAEAYFGGVPGEIWKQCNTRIPDNMRSVCRKFSKKHGPPVPRSKS